MIAIIQARLGSTRLPGKVLMEIQGKPLLAYLVERLWKCRNIGKPPVIAVPQKDLLPISRAMQDWNCTVVSGDGDENDVYGRFLDVMGKLKPGYGYTTERFARICADSPLLDPDVVDYVVADESNTVVTNTQPRTWPGGQCVEALYSVNFQKGPKYHRMGPREPMTAEDREHVTPWFYRNQSFTNVTNPLGDFSDVSMVVDTSNDFDRIKATIEKMDRPHTDYGWRELVELMQ